MHSAMPTSHANLSGTAVIQMSTLSNCKDHVVSVHSTVYPHLMQRGGLVQHAQPFLAPPFIENSIPRDPVIRKTQVGFIPQVNLEIFDVVFKRRPRWLCAGTSYSVALCCASSAADETKLG